MLQSTQLPGEFLLSVRGDFGAAEVQSIRDVLHALNPGARVFLDLSRAERMEESAIACMAELFEERNGAAIRIHGLSRHHARILAYLGAHLSEPAASQRADDS